MDLDTDLDDLELDDGCWPRLPQPGPLVTCVENAAGVNYPCGAVCNPRCAPGAEFADDTNPKDRIGLTKPPLHLVPPVAIVQMAQAMGNGAEKYGPYNWRQKKVKASIYYAAALRHLAAWFDGEEVAADSGVLHLAHALACLGIVVDAAATGNLIDDRPVAGAAGALIAALTEGP